MNVCNKLSSYTYIHMRLMVKYVLQVHVIKSKQVTVCNSLCTCDANG